MTSAELNRIDALVKDGRTISEQDLREVVTIHLRTILRVERPPKAPITLHPRQSLFVVLPLVAILVCVGLLGPCYPKAVYLWGDQSERYHNLLQRRRILWNVIVGIGVVGVLSKLLYEGLTPMFPGN